MLAQPPPFATFVHAGGRDGFEAVWFRRATTTADGYVLDGGTTAFEDDDPWSVHYRVEVDDRWQTTRVEATGVSASGRYTLRAERRDGRWRVNDADRPDLDGCVDIDVEASLVTNTLAIHRIDLDAATPQDAPAAFVRADDLRVERLEQTYRCTDRSGERIVFDYTSATFDVACDLVVDTSGIVVDYPGLGRRHR